jgi:hypothetical protein
MQRYLSLKRVVAVGGIRRYVAGRGIVGELVGLRTSEPVSFRGYPLYLAHNVARCPR